MPFQLFCDLYEIFPSKGSLIKLVFHTITWGILIRPCRCVCVHARAQLCPTLCNPMDCSLPASSIHGISQSRPCRRIQNYRYSIRSFHFHFHKPAYFNVIPKMSQSLFFPSEAGTPAWALHPSATVGKILWRWGWGECKVPITCPPSL